MCDYQANCICEDDQGYIWIGHGSVATDRLDPRTGRFEHYQYHFGDSSSISSNYVNAVIRGKKGDLWMGTLAGGLCRYQATTGKFTTYTEKDGLLDNNVTSVVEDSEGNLWLGTGKGICRYSPEKRQFSNFDYTNSPAPGKAHRKGATARPRQGVGIASPALHQPTASKIAIPTMEGLQMIPIDSIITCSSDSNYTTLHLKGRPKIIASRTLKEIEEMLDGLSFLRVHQSSLVNLNEINKYVRGEGGYLVMSDGSSIDVARSRKESLLAKLLSKRG